MHTLSKAQVSSSILLDYVAQKQVLSQKIAWFEKKYNLDFQSFEVKIEQVTTEDFEMWDDYIEWKACTHFLTELLAKIEDIRHGHFQVA